MQPKPGVVNIGPQLFHSPQPPSHSPPPSHAHPDTSQYNDNTSRHTTPLEPLSIHPQLASTLEHIVGQLDILTQVSC